MTDFPKLEVNEIMLERVRLAARCQLSPQVMHDMRVHTEFDQVFGRMLVSLETQLYRHKVDRQEVRVPFRREQAVEVPGPRGLVTVFVLMTLACLPLAWATSSWVPVVAAVVVAVLGVVLHAVNPPREVTAVAEGEAVVTREQFNTFPDNDTAFYPDHLGTPVRVATLTDQVWYRDNRGPEGRT